MKLNYTFEYTEKDYKHLTATTSDFLGQVATFLTQVVDTQHQITKMKCEHVHEIQLLELKMEKDEFEEKLDEIKEKIKAQEDDIARLNRQRKKAEYDNVVFIDDDDDEEE